MNKPIVKKPDVNKVNCGKVPRISPRQSKIFWQKAVIWVDNNDLAIRNFAARYLKFSPYKIEDFVQSAYIAAHKAAASHGEKGEPGKFKAYFWNCFRFECRQLATIPARKDVSGAGTLASPVRFVPVTNRKDICYLEDYDSPFEDSLKIDREKEVVALGLTKFYLPKKYAQTWRLILTRALCDKQIAKKLKVSRQRASFMRRDGLKRIEELDLFAANRSSSGIPTQLSILFPHRDYVQAVRNRKNPLRLTSKKTT